MSVGQTCHQCLHAAVFPFSRGVGVCVCSPGVCMWCFHGFGWCFAQFCVLCDRWRARAASHIPATPAGVITGFR